MGDFDVAVAATDFDGGEYDGNDDDDDDDDDDDGDDDDNDEMRTMTCGDCIPDHDGCRHYCHHD